MTQATREAPVEALVHARRRRTNALLSLAVAVAVAAAVALHGSTALIVPTSAGPWRALVDPPDRVRLVVGALAGGLSAWMTRRWPRPLRTPILALGLAIGPLVPILTGHLLFLLVFQGHALRLVAVAALAVLLVRALSLRRPAAPRVPGWALAALAFLLYAAFGTRVPAKQRTEGDEPHYLLMAHSLVHDGDLDLANQYAERQYWPFNAASLVPHVSDASRPGTAYSFHAPGLPVLIAPAYALGGLRGVRLFLSALIAAAAVLLRAVVRDASRDEWLAVAVWAILALSPPLPIFAVAIYPETVAACAVALLLSLRRGEPGAAAALLAGLLAGALPWLHPKNLVLGAVALALVLLRVRRRSVRAGAVACFAVGVASFLVYMRLTFGHATLSAGFGPPDLSLRRLPWGGLANLFDRQWGLFAIAPLWILAVPAALGRLRRETAETLGLVALAAAPIVVGGAFADWAGGFCPPARFPLPAVPPLALLLAPALPRHRSLAALLAGTGAGTLLLATVRPGVLRNPVLGDAGLLSALSDFDLNSMFPSFFDVGQATPVLLSLAALAACALAWRSGARGFAAGTLGYLLLASALRHGPPLDPRLATLRALESWDRGRRLEPAGALDLGRLALPIELPGAPWPLPEGEGRRTRPLDLPPGAYALSARTRWGTADAQLRIEARAGSVHLGEWTLGAADEPRLPLVLPLGAHALILTCHGGRGAPVLESLELVPSAVVALRDRGGLEWWPFLGNERYRVARGPFHVTVLEGLEPLVGASARLTSEPARLVIDGPERSVVSLRIERDGARDDDAVEWGRRRLPLGLQPDLRLRLPMAEGIPLGSGQAVVTARIRASAARVGVADVSGAGAAP